MRKLLALLALTQIVGCSALTETQHYYTYEDEFTNNKTESVDLYMGNRKPTDETAHGNIRYVTVDCWNPDSKDKDLEVTVVTNKIFGAPGSHKVDAEFYFGTWPDGWSKQSSELVKTSKVFKAKGRMVTHKRFRMKPDAEFYDELVSQSASSDKPIYLRIRASWLHSMISGKTVVVWGQSNGNVRKVIERCK